MFIALLESYCISLLPCNWIITTYKYIFMTYCVKTYNKDSLTVNKTEMQYIIFIALYSFQLFSYASQIEPCIGQEANSCPTGEATASKPTQVLSLPCNPEGTVNNDFNESFSGSYALNLNWHDKK